MLKTIVAAERGSLWSGLSLLRGIDWRNENEEGLLRDTESAGLNDGELKLGVGAVVRRGDHGLSKSLISRDADEFASWNEGSNQLPRKGVECHLDLAVFAGDVQLAPIRESAAVETGAEHEAVVAM